MNINMNCDEIDKNLNSLVEFLEKEKLEEITPYKAPLNWIVAAVICTATSTRHIRAVSHKLRRVKIDGQRMLREGDPESGWVITSSCGYLIYLFTKDVRDYYTLDQIWNKKAKI